MYNPKHFFYQNTTKRYALGTKNKSLKNNSDGSLTIYLGTRSPGKEKESNWLPAQLGTFRFGFALTGPTRPFSMAVGSRLSSRKM